MERCVFFCVMCMLYIHAAETKTSTACYGAPGISCTDHRLTCISPRVVSLTNVTLGYRQGCGALGLSSCIDTSCCREEPGDCFSPYIQSLLSVLQQICNNEPYCRLTNFTDEVRRCRNISPRYTYSKVEYECTEKGTTTNIETMTEDTDQQDSEIGGIVGGVVGSLLVMAAISTCLVIYFKRREKRQQNGQNQNAAIPDNRLTDNSKLEAPTTPEYYVLEPDNTNTSTTTTTSRHGDYDLIEDNSNSINGILPPGGDYGLARVDNSGMAEPNQNDNYNHVGVNNVVSEDLYNHLKGHNSSKPVPHDSTYNHVESLHPGEDTYHHIGDVEHSVDTDDHYNHITGTLDNGVYNHIGDSHERTVVADDTYNHIK